MEFLYYCKFFTQWQHSWQCWLQHFIVIGWNVSRRMNLQGTILSLDLWFVCTCTCAKSPWNLGKRLGKVPTWRFLEETIALTRQGFLTTGTIGESTESVDLNTSPASTTSGLLIGSSFVIKASWEMPNRPVLVLQIITITSFFSWTPSCFDGKWKSPLRILMKEWVVMSFYQILHKWRRLLDKITQFF